MRKPIQKIVALCCVGAMALTFASCKPDDTAKESTSENTTSSDVTEAPTQESTEAPAPGETVAPTDAPAATGIVKPGDVAAAVKLYNDAVAKKGAVTATITRSLSEVKALGQDVIKLVPQVPEKFDLNDAALEGADLYALDAGNVSGINVTESGDNFVIEFTLKTYEGGQDIKAGDGGYMYLIDYNTINTTVQSIGKAIDENFSIEVKELKSLSVESGKFTATINKTTGSISAASISFTEKISAKVTTSALPGSPTANIIGGGTVKYTVA